VRDEAEPADAIKYVPVTEDGQNWIKKQNNIILLGYAGIIDRITNIETAIMNPQGSMKTIYPRKECCHDGRYAGRLYRI